MATKDAMLQSPNPVVWVIVLAVIAATDFVWFAFTGNGVYELKNKVKSSHRELKAPVAVLSCAAFASLVLCSLASDGYGEAALTGAAIGGLVFFVFNACAWYILGEDDWPLGLAGVDFAYGTTLYTLVSMLAHYLSGAL